MGDLRPGLPRRRTCRRSSSCPPAAASAAARPTGRAASCPPSTPASASATRATRSSTSSSPAGVDAQAPARLARPGRRAEPPAARRRSAIPEIATRIAAYEMAFRLQTSAPELMDLQAARRKATLELYGCRPGQAVVRAGLPAGAADDRARRAVRQHLPRRLGRPLRRGRQPARTTAARPTRRPPRWCKDLKQRGLLDETLVIWGGEFGRTPMVETNPALGPQPGPRPPPAGVHDVAGRRRHQAGPDATARPTTSASTSSRTPVHVHDLQATILHLPRPRPRAADLPPRRPRLPPDRRLRQGDSRSAGMIAVVVVGVASRFAIW